MLFILQTSFSYYSAMDTKAKIFTATGKPETIQLSTGAYVIECWGAQGGTGMKNAELINEGGRGAYTSGILQINGSQILHLYVGTKGGNGNATKNTMALGGWNGGGKSGADTYDNDGSGGGGGATDIRLVSGEWNSKSSLVSRIMVAAGGSGSAFDTKGAPGGLLTGYIASSTSTYQDAPESSNLGFGEDGENHSHVPSSGAGGGYFGGLKSKPQSGNYYLSVSSSGTSYVSGFPGCKSVDENGEKTESPVHYSKLEFLHPYIFDGFAKFLSPSGVLESGHEGDGAIKIAPLEGTIQGITYVNRTYCINKRITQRCSQNMKYSASFILILSL